MPVVVVIKRGEDALFDYLFKSLRYIMVRALIMTNSLDSVK